MELSLRELQVLAIAIGTMEDKLTEEHHVSGSELDKLFNRLLDEVGGWEEYRKNS